MDGIITIKYGKWQAEIAPSVGGNLISLLFDGQYILRRPKDIETLKASPCLYGLPLLLPANRVKDATFEFHRVKYHLPMNEPARGNHLHGLLNSASFEVVDKDENCVSTILRNNGEYYPFPFDICIKDCLDDAGLRREIVLKNTGSLSMPYTMAFHATFVEPKVFTVPLGQRYLVDERMIPTGQLRDLTSDEICYCNGMDPRAGQVSGFYTSAGNIAKLDGFSLKVSNQFDNWVLFNAGGGKDFLCIEPQCGAVDGLNNGRHRILEPNQYDIFTLEIHKNSGEPM